MLYMFCFKINFVVISISSSSLELVSYDYSCKIHIIQLVFCLLLFAIQYYGKLRITSHILQIFINIIRIMPSLKDFML